MTWPHLLADLVMSGEWAEMTHAEQAVIVCHYVCSDRQSRTHHRDVIVIARLAGLDPKSVKRANKSLTSRGLISRHWDGDHSHAADTEILPKIMERRKWSRRPRHNGDSGGTAVPTMPPHGQDTSVPTITVGTPVSLGTETSSRSGQKHPHGGDTSGPPSRVFIQSIHPEGEKEPADDEGNNESALFTEPEGATQTPPTPTPNPAPPSPAKNGHARRQNPIWDAVAAIWFEGDVKRPARSRVGKIVRDLEDYSATPEDIHARIEGHKRIYPTIKVVTPESLVKHWVDCGRASSAAVLTIPQDLQGRFAQHHYLQKPHEFTLEEQKLFETWLQAERAKP